MALPPVRRQCQLRLSPRLYMIFGVILARDLATKITVTAILSFGDRRTITTESIRMYTYRSLKKNRFLANGGSD
ncbi:MAG: hypothetical protein ACFC03_00665 [Candidatus Malihini olakiniferum]